MDWKTKSGRRVVTVAVYALASVVIVGTLLFMLTHSLQQNNEYGGVLSALLAMFTTFFSVVFFLRRTDPPLQVEQEAAALVLEVLGQWELEVKHRRQRFGDSRTIPLSWASAGQDVGDDPVSVIGSDVPLGTVRLKLEGRLEDNPDRATSQLAELFDRIPSKRLVLLGEPGAGKTFLGITLTVGLLRQRVAGAPVPVFLSLSSWDPISDSLDDWIVRSLASAHYGGRERAPRALLTARLILPVLDGLDELPEHLRRPAISRINDTLDGDRPLVLTCRSAEYKDGLAGGAPVLLRAPVVEVLPVSIADIVAHLDGHTSWTGVTEHVEKHPDGPLATALTTPLMLSLFVAAYQGREPTDLLGDKFTSRYAVEDHLVDLLLDTVYPEDTTRDGGRRSGTWTAQQARAWLTYLAQYLHRHDERDLVWWQLARRTLSPWTAPALGLIIGFIAFWLADTFSLNDFATNRNNEDHKNDPISKVLGSPSLFGTIFGVVVASLWLVGDRRARGRTLPAADPDNKSFGRGFDTGTLLILIPGMPLLLGSSLEPSYGYQYIVQMSALAGALLALAVVSGLAVGFHELLMTRSMRIGQASPEAFLRQDRRSALSAAAITALMVGAASGVAATIAAAFAGHVGERIALALELPTVANLDMPPLETHVPWPLWPGNTPALIMASILLMVLFALAVLTTRAWTRFLVARISLAISGNLPWRLMRFLADARDRGLLRGAGGSYQFWHVRLQERLVATAAPKKSTAKRQRLQHVAIGFMIAAIVLVVVVPLRSAEPASCDATGWTGVDHRMSRTTISDNSTCFVVLNRDQWHVLGVRTSDISTLDGIKSVSSVPYQSANHIYVVGELNQVKPSTWHNILDGVAAAQDINNIPLAVDFLHYTRHDRTLDSDVNSLTRLYLDTAAPIDSDAINIDVTESNLGSKFQSEMIIGLPAMNFHKLREEYIDHLVNNWLSISRHAKTDLRPDALSGEIDEEICSTLREGPEHLTTTWTFDLRSAALSKEKIDRIEHCGRATILVNESQAGELSAQQLKSPMIDFVRVQDKSTTILTDCEETLAAQAPAGSMDACVGILAAITDFRTVLAPVAAEN